MGAVGGGAAEAGREVGVQAAAAPTAWPPITAPALSKGPLDCNGLGVPSEAHLSPPACALARRPAPLCLNVICGAQLAAPRGLGPRQAPPPAAAAAGVRSCTAASCMATRAVT